jgi:hypothetical protein
LFLEKKLNSNLSFLKKKKQKERWIFEYIPSHNKKDHCCIFDMTFDLKWEKPLLQGIAILEIVNEVFILRGWIHECVQTFISMETLEKFRN